jgi:sugar O-acyltransferase (sialic acid O-acetyltransferase NeuD family)
VKVLIIGAGGHGQVVADILLARLKAGHLELEPIGFLDDDLALHGRSFLGLPALGNVPQISSFAHDAVVVAIGDNRTRQKISQRLQSQGEQLVTAVHPSAVVGSDVEIGEGTMVCAGVVVNPGTHLGQGVILNTGCTVDHHNQIGDYVHVAPGAHLGGDVRVGEGALVGIGASLIPGRTIGAWSVLGAGSVVIEDIPAHVTAAGVPARVIRG